MYYWDFNGDGVTDRTSSSSATTQAFPQGGLFDVTLIVSNLTSSVGVSLTKSGFLRLMPSTIRVVAGNANSAPPYDTWANAAATIHQAVAFALDGVEIVVSNGTYSSAVRLDLVKPLTVRGLTGDPADVKIYNTKTDRGAGYTVYCHNPDAILESVTIGPETPLKFYGATGYTYRPQGIYIDTRGGTVSNCVIRNTAVDINVAPAAAVSMNSDDAVVSHCIVTNTLSVGESNSRGIVEVAKGLLSNCLIAGNFAQHGYGSTAINDPFVQVTSGRMENCTVAGNIQMLPKINDPVVSSQSSGSVVNTVIADNKKADASPVMVVSGDLGRFSHCASDLVAINVNCLLIGNPGQVFVDVAGKDYRPVRFGLLTDCGAMQGVALPAVDLDGNPRVEHKVVDIGCYKARYIPRGAVILVK